MRGINKQAMLDLIIEAKRNEPEDVRFSDWLAEYLADRLSTLTPPNEPLTLEDAKKERYIWFTPLNDWAKVTPFGVLFFGSEELMNWETLCEEWGYRFKAYRRPPEVSP
ncbi:MAG: hypothetical protein ACLR28_04890 [Flavonifractor plautii]